MRLPKELCPQFNFHPELCVGCYACVTACLDEHDDLPVTDTPLRRVFTRERSRGGTGVLRWYSVACLHCQEHPCIDACPKDCFSLDTPTGTVQLNAEHCIGCRACQRVCAYDGIVFRDGKAAKCDGCLERLRMGQTPRCVDACPRHAITIDDRPAVREACQKKLAGDLKTK
jgi:Fe-S-cluster-containing dehydrogenase component